MQGTGLANSQASVVPWIRASLAGLGMGRSALEALASCCGSGFPSMQGGVGPLLQLEGCDCRSGFEGWWCPSTPPLRCCCTLCPPWIRGIVLGHFDTGGGWSPAIGWKPPLYQAWRYEGGKAELDGELPPSVGPGWERTS